MALHAFDNRLALDKESYNTDILESDFERSFILNSVPAWVKHILLPQRSLVSITHNQTKHHSQRVDFACEFPYSEEDAAKGVVFEIDGDAYHSESTNVVKDAERVRDLEKCGWHCARVTESGEIDFSALDSNPYCANVAKAYDRGLDTEWIKHLQLVLSPIGVSRIQKTIVEALLADKLDITKEKLRVLVLERDVPCDRAACIR